MIIIRLMKKYIFIPTLLLTIILLAGCSDSGTKNNSKPFNPANDEYISVADRIEFDEYEHEYPVNVHPTLNVPTQITRIDDLYFIVDCYNNQIIFNENLTDPISEWGVMTTQITMAHTVASDGYVYLVDDTENHRVLIMEKRTDENGEYYFSRTGIFNNIGTRPHCINYDEATDTFYVLSSMTGQIFLFRRAEGTGDVYLTSVKSFPELDGYYIRSFTIIGDELFLVSGDASITVVDMSDFTVKCKYPVPNELVGMIQIIKIQDYFYITVSTDGYGSQDAATIIRTKDLSKLINGEYEDVYHYFIGGGTPYYISLIDGNYYLCEHRLPGHSIWRFNVKDNEITNPETIY